MSGIRLALFFSTGQRYYHMVINFVTVIILSRLLTPGEIGISATATAITAIAYSVQQFASMEFLIAHKELTRMHVRTAFTVLLLLTTVISGVLLVSAKMIAGIYHENGLAPYLQLAAISILLQLIPMPIVALWRREMSFDKVAIMDVSSVTINAVVTISLAWIGFSYMSFAWGLFAAAVASAFLALYIRSDLWLFRPMLYEWRAMVRFGGYAGTNVVLYQLSDALPALLIGRLISFDALGLYNRALAMSQLPDKVFISGIVAVALPVFSAKFREQPNLKRSYLKAVEYITAVQWPALVGLAILAHPAVSILLGSQWLRVALLVQIIALGRLFTFSFSLNYDLLRSIGALRDTLVRAIITWPVSAVIIVAAIFFGLTAVAFSYWIIVPFQALVAMSLVRRHINFSWRELLSAMQKSAIVTMSSAVGPLAVVALSKAHFDMSIGEAMIAIVLSAIGWVGGLWITKHPILMEVQSFAIALRTLFISSRFWRGSFRD